MNNRLQFWIVLLILTAGTSLAVAAADKLCAGEGIPDPKTTPAPGTVMVSDSFSPNPNTPGANEGASQAIESLLMRYLGDLDYIDTVCDNPTASCKEGETCKLMSLSSSMTDRVDLEFEEVPDPRDERRVARGKRPRYPAMRRYKLTVRASSSSAGDGASNDATRRPWVGSADCYCVKCE